MAGTANDAEVPKIYRFIIICSREAFWEAMRKKISSPCAVDVIEKSISEPKILRGSNEAKNNLSAATEATRACASRDVLSRDSTFDGRTRRIICFRENWFESDSDLVVGG